MRFLVSIKKPQANLVFLILTGKFAVSIKKTQTNLFVAQYITIHSLKPQFYETETVRVVIGL